MWHALRLLGNISSIVKLFGLWRLSYVQLAKTLEEHLGEGMRRQLHRDGAMSGLTFVPSKIDDINIKEILPALEQDADFTEEYALIEDAIEEARHKLEMVSGSIADLHERLSDKTSESREVNLERKVYITLQDLGAKGKTIYPPFPPSHRAKKQKLTSTMFDSSKPPLSFANVQQKLKELEQLRDVLDEKVQDLEIELNVALPKKEEAAKKLKACREQAWFACVRRRNELSVKDIQRDFLNGMRDLNRNDPQNDRSTSPSEDVYDERDVRKALRVICVSARGYQKLTGGMQGQRIAASFPDIAATGITDLRDHACNLAEAKMLAGYEAFVNEAKRLLTSLGFWCAANGGQELAKAHLVDQTVYTALVDDFIKVQNIEIVASRANVYRVSLILREGLCTISRARSRRRYSVLSPVLYVLAVKRLFLSHRNGRSPTTHTKQSWNVTVFSRTSIGPTT